MNPKFILLAMALTVTSCVSTKRYERDIKNLSRFNDSFYKEESQDILWLHNRISALEKWREEQNNSISKTRNKCNEEFQIDPNMPIYRPDPINIFKELEPK